MKDAGRRRRVSATVRVCCDGRMGRGGIVRRPADAGQPQRARRRPARPAGTSAATANQGAGPEDCPMTPRRPWRTSIEQLPRRRSERRRGAGDGSDGSAGPTATATATATASAAATIGSTRTTAAMARRTGGVEHSQRGYPPTASAEAQAGATSRGCSNVADVVGKGGSRRRGQERDRRGTVRWLLSLPLCLLLLLLIIPGHGGLFQGPNQ